MNLQADIFLGIDPTAGRNPYTWAALDKDCRLLCLEGGELDQVLAYAGAQASILAAINAPSCPNRGLLRTKLVLEHPDVNLRGADMRMVEHLLRERGIPVPPTPSREESCPTWIQMGFGLHRELGKMGFANYPSEDSPRQNVEVNSHAIFCTLLGDIPLPKPTLEGRLQRQLVLHGRGAEIIDPMEFFEEITRHKLIKGSLPMEFIYETNELDALAAALTGWMTVNTPDEILILGDKAEGQMVIPVKELKEKYT